MPHFNSEGNPASCDGLGNKPTFFAVLNWPSQARQNAGSET